VLLGGAFAAIHRAGKITDENSVWILKKEGAGNKGTQFLGKEINFSTWKQMSECGIPSRNERSSFTNLGQKTEIINNKILAECSPIVYVGGYPNYAHKANKLANTVLEKP
jgi:hypothetical protein